MIREKKSVWNRKKYKRAVNKLVRTFNKDIENDWLWNGRFVISQDWSLFYPFEDKSGAQYYVGLVITDKKTGHKEYSCFDNFDIETVSKYDEEKVEELRENKGIVRNKLKINAAINNAKVFMEIQKEFGSFSNYIWGFTDNKILKDTEENYQTSSPLSDKITKDLKKRGMKFVGTTIIYSYLESIGIINNHIHECFRYEE